MDAEMWVPLTDLQVATRRDTLSCVTVTMGEADFGEVDVFTKQRLDLGLTAIQEGDYFGSVMRFYKPVQRYDLDHSLAGFPCRFAGWGEHHVRGVRRTDPRSRHAPGTRYSRLAITWSLTQESVLTAFAGALLGFC